MKPMGQLSVRLEHLANRDEILWEWVPARGSASFGRSHSTRIDGGWGKVLDSFRSKNGKWSQFDSERTLGNWNTARELLRDFMRRLHHAMLDGDTIKFLRKLGPRNAFVTVKIKEDFFPLELLDIGTEGEPEPFSVRYRTMFVKTRDERDTGTPPRRVSSEGRQGRRQLHARVFIALKSLGPRPGDDEELNTHTDTIQESMHRLYGGSHDCVLIGQGNNVDHAWDVLAATETDCLYWLGHGEPGGLLLETGSGSTERLETHGLVRELQFADNAHRSFAFINSCHSAAGGSDGAMDVVMALLAGGYRTVLGTVLPPLLKPMARAAERFFGEAVVKENFNLVELLHTVQTYSWQLFQGKVQGSAWEGDIAWACYRLYGLPDHSFLPTNVTNSRGDAVIRTVAGDAVPVGSLAEKGKKIVSSDQSKVSMRLRVRAKAGKEPSVPEWLRGMVKQKKLQPAAEALRWILEFGSDEVLWECFGPEVLEALIRLGEKSRRESLMRSALHGADKSGAPVSSEAVISLIGNGFENLFADLRLRYVRKDQSCPSLKIGPGSQIEKLLLKAIRVSRPGQPLSMVDVLTALPGLKTREDTVIYLKDEKPGSVEKETTLRLARFFARRHGKEKIDPVHLFCSVLVQAVSSGLLASSSKEGLRPEQLVGWVKGFDAAEPLPERADLTETAKAHWSFADVCRKNSGPRHATRPFWWHLLGSLCENDWDGLAGDLGKAGMDTVHLWRITQGLLAYHDARVAMPTLTCTAVPVGRWYTALPQSLYEEWSGPLKALAAEAAKADQPLMVVVPWMPSADSAFHDAFCESAARLVLFEPENIAAARRHWVHFKAGELLSARLTTSFLRSLMGQEVSSARKARQMLKEAAERGVLCLQGMQDWLDEEGKALKPSARKTLKAIRASRIPIIAFIARKEWNKDLQEKIWMEAGFRTVHLSSPSKEILAKFLAGWDLAWPVHTTPETRELFSALVADKALDKSPDDLIGWSLRVLAKAHILAGDGPLRLDHVDQAAREVG